MELGKEATLVVQIPALLLPTQGSWTVVFLPVLGSQLWDRPPPSPLQVQALSRLPGCLEVRKGRALPPALPRYTLPVHTAPGGGVRPLGEGSGPEWRGVTGVLPGG